MKAKFMRHRIPIIAAAVVLVIVVGIVGGVLYSASLGKGAAVASGVTPIDFSNDGIAPDTAFLLSPENQSQSLEALEQSIAIEPAMPFSLHQNEQESLYTLTLGRILAPLENLTITLNGQEYSFTAQNRLVVTKTSPVNGASNIPLASGIEFSFNTPSITVDEFTDAFSVSPHVDGEFDTGDGRFVFYPTKDLAPNTGYTVTLSGLTTTEGATLRDTFTLEFKTARSAEDSEISDLQRKFQFFGNGISVNSLTSETPVFRAYLDPDLGSFAANDEVAVKAYALSDAQSYSRALENLLGAEATENTEINTSNMPLIADFSLTPFPTASGEISSSYVNIGSWIFQFPQPMPKGWYVVDFSFEKRGQTLSRQQLLQVSDTSVFCMWTEDSGLAWVNDASTGKPIEKATISLDGGFTATATTGEDGTAIIADAATAVLQDQYNTRLGSIITVTHGDDVFVDLNNYYSYQAYASFYLTSLGKMQYINYIYTDRPIYHTTDTIRAWGVLRSRDETVIPQPTAARLQLVDGQTVLAETSVTVHADGTFTGELPFEGLANSWPHLELLVGDMPVTTSYIQIDDYVKPIYTADTTTDKPVYMPGISNDEAVVTAQVSLFDGTPASRFALELSTSMPVLESTPETNANGIITARLQLPDEYNTWYPSSHYYSFSNTSAQDESFYLSGSIYTIDRDVMLRGQSDAGTRGNSITISTNRVDISGITDTKQIWDYENITGAPIDVDVSAALHKVYYTKTSAGNYYDYINRQSVETYTYNKHDDIVETYTLRTVGGTALLENLPESTGDASYYVILSCKDTQSRIVEYRVYLGADYSRYGYTASNMRYELRKLTSEQDIVTDPYYKGAEPYYYIDRTRFRDGESVGFALYQNDTAIQNAPGRILYSIVQDKIDNAHVSQSGQVTVPFAESLLPNYVITGAYFDGKHVYELNNTHMYFNPEDRQLDISLVPDKTSYAPGENITVRALVTNEATGLAAPNVSLVLSAVDEAVFAISEQYTNILQSIYQSVYYPSIEKYASSIPLYIEGAGEMGGGGGDGGMRKDFADTAAFTTATTGEDGTALFTFHMPDNITEWRLTSLGINSAGFAGQTTSNVITTKPFFVTPVINSTLLDGDSVSFGLCGAGVSVSDYDITNYTITVNGNGVNEVRSISSPLRQYATVDFGKLPAGEYTVTVEGTCGTYTDAVQLPFEINPSGVEVSMVRSFELADGIDAHPLRWPVSVVLYGENAKVYNMVLQNLVRNSGGQRADMRLARTYAAELMREAGNGWFDSEALEQDLSDIDGHRIFSLFPYTENDLELSIKAHLAVPHLVGADYLDNMSPEDLSGYSSRYAGAVYIAQALLGNLQVAGLQNFIGGSYTGFTDKVYATLAMALAGDESGALALYNELVKPTLVQVTGVSGLSMLMVANEDAYATAAASLLATTLGTTEAAGLVTWLSEKGSEYDPFLLEQMAFLSKFKPSGNSSAFSYVLGGQTQNIRLDGDGMHVLTLTQQQFENANFQTTAGTVYADVYYIGGTEELNEQSPSNRLGLTKTIRPVGTNVFEVGGLVEITLRPIYYGLSSTVGNLTLYVDDYIPSGMRYVHYQHDNTSRSNWYLNSRQQQRLQFTIYGKFGYLSSAPIVYYARITTPGQYVVESAYISSAAGESWGLSERSTVNID